MKKIIISTTFIIFIITLAFADHHITRGPDGRGIEVGTGIYFCKLTTEKTDTIKKLVLIR